MANFFFYRYHFVQADDPDLFSEPEIGVTNYDERHNPRFAEDLACKAGDGCVNKLNLYEFKVDKTTGEQTSVQYENDIFHCLDDVVMLQVRNNKHKKVIPIDKLEALDVPHYPYTFVIVDMRPGSQAILVQQKKAAFNNPDAVARLVLDYCTRELQLAKFGVRMTLEKRLCMGSIWDVVTMRTERGQDRVKSFTLKIDKKRPNENNNVDKALQMVLEMMCAAEGELKLSTKGDAKALLDETREDVRNVVDMLIQNKYHMMVRFERSGSVEYGRETAAIYGIDDEFCLEFMNKEPHIDEGNGYHLFEWLNMLMPEGAGYSYKQSERRKRNGKKAC
jgi:hypothetical protein